MVDNNKIALLYFSRTAQPESRIKAWFSDGPTEKNKVLASLLIHHTSRVLQRSGLPVFHYHEGKQSGRSFGERLANAYQEVFDLGFEAVIAVGNDTPELANVDWQQVISSLESGQCILGPTFRQGAYLIGITRSCFEQSAFRQLPWQSAALFASLIEFCSRERDLVLLPMLLDINNSSDLKKLIKRPAVHPSLRRIFLNLLQAYARIEALPADQAVVTQAAGSALFRGPPTL